MSSTQVTAGRSRAAGATPAPSRPGGFGHFWRTLKQLFHEVTGAMFAVLALAWLNSALRAWSRDVAHWLIGVAVAVALLFVAFAVTSFRRASKL